MEISLLPGFTLRYKPQARSKSIKIKAGAFRTLDVSYPASVSLSVVNDFILNRADTIRDSYLKHNDNTNALFDFISINKYELKFGDRKLQFIQSSDKHKWGTCITRKGLSTFYYHTEEDLCNYEIAGAAIKAIIQNASRYARKLLPLLVKELAAKYSFKYGSLSFRNQKTRWGSCSSNNNISLNIRLVLLPRELTEYVIIHELAHTVHKNHSPRFWNLVTQIIPDTKLKRQRLKKMNYSFLNM
ncbi:MAG: M48 family metallopeptidase [Spirochaetes bacterium]|nr:M48 family metallopeptidase [Spirochaetota bacterium]